MDKVKIKRLDGYVYRFAWLCVVSASGWAGTQLSQINSQINQLNINMAVVLEKLQSHDKSIEQYGAELKNLTKKKGS